MDPGGGGQKLFLFLCLWEETLLRFLLEFDKIVKLYFFGILDSKYDILV